MPLNDFVFLIGSGALPDPVAEQNAEALVSELEPEELIITNSEPTAIDA